MEKRHYKNQQNQRKSNREEFAEEVDFNRNQDREEFAQEVDFNRNQKQNNRQNNNDNCEDCEL